MLNPSKICKENIFLFVQKISYHCLHVPLYKEMIIYSWMNVYEGYSFLAGRHCLIKCGHLLNSHKIQNPTCFVPSLAFILYLFFWFVLKTEKVMKQNKLTNICKKVYPSCVFIQWFTNFFFNHQKQLIVIIIISITLILVKFWKLGTGRLDGKTIPSITWFWCRIIISTRFIWHLTGADTGLDWHGVLNDAVMIVCRLDIIVHMTVHACSNHSIQLHLGCVGYWIPNKIFSESALFSLILNYCKLQ